MWWVQSPSTPKPSWCLRSTYLWNRTNCSTMPSPRNSLLDANSYELVFPWNGKRPPPPRPTPHKLEANTSEYVLAPPPSRYTRIQNCRTISTDKLSWKSEVCGKPALQFQDPFLYEIQTKNTWFQRKTQDIWLKSEANRHKLMYEIQKKPMCISSKNDDTFDKTMLKLCRNSVLLIKGRARAPALKRNVFQARLPAKTQRFSSTFFKHVFHTHRRVHTCANRHYLRWLNILKALNMYHIRRTNGDIEQDWRILWSSCCVLLWRH